LACLLAAREAGAVPGPAQFSLRLAKEDFAFAAAHFTLLPDGDAERLHGHNYRVRAVLAGPALDGEGMLVPVAPVKAAIRALCASLDERILIAEKSPRLELGREGETLSVRLGNRDYRFPAAEVALLPIPNVTIESLAQHLWQGLAPTLASTPVTRLRLEVEETAGQSASYESPL
ncbi:MAG: 6-carboxytetrahydropterin synthase, partial [Myxococcota bacterium]